ncbi:DsbA family protein [Bombilactobacillus folatiphilus]|uniref:DsbA family protein n=1 Tax=Bombilactobacillus folatiphilus TaxID=2923362 RepID=A0ABY4P7V2_9LACO|nr:DsbA family protein [Bombilactobacillus folatiphilus]UQS81732.1 DsbA family protein [Bombilactobacillus folatiphilus]
MWEVFVFVNPIGQRCLRTEQAIIDFAKEHHINAHLKFIALNNFISIDNYLKNNHYNLRDINLRNHLTRDIYQATVYYKAATFQGNKSGRQFLIDLQHAINFQGQNFSVDLVKQIALDNHLDWTSLQQDVQSELTLNQCLEDQKIASELKITNTPTSVIYDYSGSKNKGLCIPNCSQYELHLALNSLLPSSANDQETKTSARPALHLLK